MIERGRALAASLVAIAAVIALGLGACAVFGGDPPPLDTCSADEECFQAQGERCELDAGVCVMIDAGGTP